MRATGDTTLAMPEAADAGLSNRRAQMSVVFLHLEKRAPFGRCTQTPYREWNWAIERKKSDELSQLWFFYRFF